MSLSTHQEGILALAWMQSRFHAMSCDTSATDLYHVYIMRHRVMLHEFSSWLQLRFHVTSFDISVVRIVCTSCGIASYCMSLGYFWDFMQCLGIASCCMSLVRGYNWYEFSSCLHSRLHAMSFYLSVCISCAFSYFIFRILLTYRYMRTCVYIHTYAYTYFYIHIHPKLHIYVYIYKTNLLIYVYVCTYIYMYVCIHAYMYVHMYIYIFIYIYIYMYMYMYKYI